MIKRSQNLWHCHFPLQTTLCARLPHSANFQKNITKKKMVYVDCKRVASGDYKWRRSCHACLRDDLADRCWAELLKRAGGARSGWQSMKAPRCGRWLMVSHPTHDGLRWSAWGQPRRYVNRSSWAEVDSSFFFCPSRFKKILVFFFF